MFHPWYMSKRALKTIFGACHQLENVDLSASHVGSTVGDSAITSLAENNSRLSTLKLYLDFDITDASFTKLADCSQMKRLNLTGVSHISEANLIHNVSCWPLLEELLLHHKSGSFIPTDALVAAICKSCPFMRVLSLRSAIKITDASVYTIAETYPGLEKISLPDTITSDAVKVLVKKCNKLISFSRRNLAARGTSMINDDVLVIIGENCKDLKCLDIPNCPLVTAVGLSIVANNCKKLNRVCVGMVSGDLLNRPLLTALRDNYPNISWDFR